MDTSPDMTPCNGFGKNTFAVLSQQGSYLPAASPAASCRSWPHRTASQTGLALSSARWCSATGAAGGGCRWTGLGSRTGDRWCSLLGWLGPGSACSSPFQAHSSLCNLVGEKMKVIGGLYNQKVLPCQSGSVGRKGWDASGSLTIVCQSASLSGGSALDCRCFISHMEQGNRQGKLRENSKKIRACFRWPEWRGRI